MRVRSMELTLYRRAGRKHNRCQLESQLSFPRDIRMSLLSISGWYKERETTLTFVRNRARQSQTCTGASWHRDIQPGACALAFGQAKEIARPMPADRHKVH